MCVSPQAATACRDRSREELAGRRGSSLHGRHTGEDPVKGLELDTWGGTREERALKEPWGRGQKDSR